MNSNFTNIQCINVYLLSVLMICACGTAQTKNSSKESFIATYRNGQIVKSDLPRDVLYNEEHKLYKFKLNRIRKAIQEKYFENRAKQEGVSVETFKQKHITSRIAVTNEEIEIRYTKAMNTIREHYKYRFNRLTQLEQESKISNFLRIEQNSNKTFEAQVTELFEKRIASEKEYAELRRFIRNTGVKIYLPEPIPPVFDIPIEGYPSIGPATAPITLVTFSDFQCPYSQQAASALKKLVETFPDKLRLVFRYFPLTKHENAQMAAEAAACAHEQGRFWEYHDLLFANQENLEIDDLIEYASRLKLDMDQFKHSLQSRKYEKNIKNGKEQSKTYSIIMTPAFYVNGKPKRQTTTEFFEELYEPINELLGNGQIVRPSQPNVLAEVDGITVTENDLPKGRLYEIEEEIYQTTWEETKKLLEQKLVTLAANERGITVDSLYHQEIATIPTLEELDAQYNLFQSYVAGNPRLMYLDEQAREKEILTLLNIIPDAPESFENLVRQKLSEIIQRQKLEKGKPLLMASLMNEFNAQIHLTPPTPPVYDITTEGYPSIGSKNAPTTIVVFSDFQCPYSQKVTPTINQVLARYSDQVRVVFRNFPLTKHKEAQKAHEAALCAGEQGKFWEYHDLLFAHQNTMDIENLKHYASEAQLNVEQFNRCLDSGKYAESVKQDVEEALTYGVSGTPSFYINGVPRKIRSFEQFAWYITGEKEGSPTPSRIAAQSVEFCQ